MGARNLARVHLAKAKGADAELRVSGPHFARQEYFIRQMTALTLLGVIIPQLPLYPIVR